MALNIHCTHIGCNNVTIGRNTTCSAHHDYVLAEKEKAAHKDNLARVGKFVVGQRENILRLLRDSSKEITVEDKMLIARIEAATEDL